MNIYLVRHGETDLNLQNRIQGQINTYDLNETGKSQVLSLVSRIKNGSLQADSILSSPLKRAAQTAQPIADFFSLPLGFDDRLQEINCGSYEGLNIDDVKAIQYETPLVFHDAQTDEIINVSTGQELRDHYQSPDLRFDLIAHPEGETKKAARARAVQAIAEHVSNYPGHQHVWIITHSTIMKLLLSAFAPSFTDQKINCTDIIHFVLNDNKWNYQGKL